jgi:seryl-tRNA synthetase
MHDIRAIRENPEAFDAALKSRGIPPQAIEILALDERRRALQTELQELQNRRNAASRDIGAAMKAGDKARAETLKRSVEQDKVTLQSLEAAEAATADSLEALLLALPNLPAPDVPVGPDETANVERRRVGTPRAFDFEPKEHDALGGARMDFDAAAKLSGARFVVLKGALARLERALAQFMLDLHTGEFGYTEIIPPLLVRDQAMLGTAQLPKFREEQFLTTDGFWLIPTAEVSLTNLVRESILDEEALPFRLTAWTPCFRREAGAAGRDTRGMIRQHQFSKVELVSIVRPEDGPAELERMTACAEAVLQRLGLPYRVMLLSSGDMGFAARRTYDLEVWLPGQKAYREISSCSWCGEFQARRMGARIRVAAGKGTRFVHTLNGSGLAVGRTLIAILENYQQADGSVVLPDALKPYMGGLARIDPVA